MEALNVVMNCILIASLVTTQNVMSQSIVPHMKCENNIGTDMIKTLKDFQDLLKTELIGQMKKEINYQMDQLKKEMIKATDELKEEMNENINQVKKEVKEVTKKLFRQSAFHAVSTSDQGIGVIVFKDVLTNIGCAYDSTTGIFTALTKGVHIFSWSVETYGVRTDTVLEVNGNVYGRVTADESSSYYDTSTSFAVLELNEGDAVNIRVKRGTAKSTQTMFSGWHSSSSDPMPAFYASLTSRRNASVFLFDQVYTNQGSIYTSHNGYFTAPRDGLYVFTSSVSVYGSKEYKYYINAKGMKGPQNWVDSSSGNYDNTGSMHVAYMTAGEKAYVLPESNKVAESGSMFAGWMTTPGSPSNYPVFIASTPYNSTSSPMLFNKTHISPHTGFDSYTGIFTATIRGVYVFFWNIESKDKVTTSSLRVNDVDKGQTRSDGRRASYDDSAAVSVLLSWRSGIVCLLSYYQEQCIRDKKLSFVVGFSLSCNLQNINLILRFNFNTSFGIISILQH